MENLALSGIKQQGQTDLDTIRKYHPEVLAAFVFLCMKLGKSIDWNALHTVPPELDFSGSGYRDHAFDPAVKNSPHNFAMALDVNVSPLNAHDVLNRPAVFIEQARWITTAKGIFSGAGFYPFQNTIHLDMRTPDWMKAYGGTPYWVKDPTAAKPYKGFWIYDEAYNYAKFVSQKSA